MINYGLKLTPIQPDNYIFGSSPLSIPDILPSGDWRPYLPKYEPQFDGFETYGCTVWGGQNQTEILLKFLTGVEHNFDEQFNYNIVEVESPGADPQLYYESQRKQFLTEGVFPKALTLEEFKKPRPMTDRFLNEAKKFQYLINHEWLFTNNPTKEVRLNMLRLGLKKCPVAISVSAWASDSNDLYYNFPGVPNNHWVVCIAIEDDCPIIFDSYDQSIKKLHPDHQIQVAKLVYITKKVEVQEKLDSIWKILKWIAEQIGILQKQSSKPIEVPTPPVIVQPDPILPQPEPVKPSSPYKWGNIAEVRHSIRVICDEYNWSVLKKDLACDIASSESQFNPTATNVKGNYPPSTDRGLYMWNDHYHPEISDEDAYNPEKATRLFIKAINQGHISWWKPSQKNWNRKGKYDSLL